MSKDLRCHLQVFGEAQGLSAGISLLGSFAILNDFLQLVLQD